MTTFPDLRYGISVIVDTYKPGYWCSATEWNARQHRVIEMFSTLTPAARQPYTREEVFAVYRWSAGVLARAALDLEYEVKTKEQERGHRCDPTEDPCGVVSDGWISDPRAAMEIGTSADGEVQDYGPPQIGLHVPTQRAEAWAGRFRRHIADMLAADMTPMGPPPTGHLDKPVILNDPTPAHFRGAPA
jgi:hypothetical protein